MNALDCSAIILAGGKSSRMGVDKAFLPYGDGLTLFEQCCGILQSIFNEVVAVVKDKKDYSKYRGIVITEDNKEVKGEGPLAGIYTGLNYISNSAAFVLACDMPLVTVNIIRMMLENIPDGCDVFIPGNGEMLEPLCGIYRKGTEEIFEAMLSRGEKRVREIVRYARVSLFEYVQKGITTDVFHNVNTIQDVKVTAHG